MAIELTTPVPIGDIAYQAITKVDLLFPHYVDTGANNAIKIDKGQVRLIFEVTTWAGDGTVIEAKRYMEEFSNWPAAFTTDVRAVYDRVEQFAISQGYIGPGTGEVL